MAIENDSLLKKLKSQIFFYLYSMDEKTFKIEDIEKKIENGLTLTKKEERYYLKYARNYTDEEIDVLFAIVNNKNPNKLID